MHANFMLYVEQFGVTYSSTLLNQT